MKYIWILLTAITFSGCNRHFDSTKNLLLSLSTNLEKHPDSVLIQLDSIAKTENLNSQDKLQWNLLFIRAYDEKYYQIPNDSIIEYTAQKIIDKENISDRAYSLFYLGRLYTKREDYNKAMEAYLSALDYAKKAKVHRLTGLLYSYISKIHKKGKRYDRGIKALKQAEYYYSLSHSSRSQIFALLDIGSFFSYMELSDSAFFYYTKAEVIARHINDKDALSSISFQVSKTYWDQNDLESAEYYLNECLEELQDNSLKNKIELLRIQIHIKQGRLYEAKSQIQQLLKSENNLSQIMRASNYISLVKIERKLSNYKEALIWQDKYINLYDSIISIRLKTNTPIIELNKQISILQADNDGMVKKNTIYMYLLITSFIICLFLFILYYIKNKKIRQLFSQVQILKKENQEYAYRLQENSILISKINILSQTPSHKQNEVQKKLEELSLEKEITSQNWAELESKINQEHNNIIQNLKSNYPSLTNEDYQTIILILLGYKSGEIATILNIEMVSLKKRRQRLRQRLGLSEKDVLEDFIENYSNNQ